MNGKLVQLAVAVSDEQEALPEQELRLYDNLLFGVKVIDLLIYLEFSFYLS